MQQLKSTQKKYLRSIAHHLKAIVQIGKKGLTDALLKEIEKALDDHELIKIKFLEFKDDKKTLSSQILEIIDCEFIGKIGNIIILYRENPEIAKRKINIPA